MRVGLLYDLANPPEWHRDWAEFYRYELDQTLRAENLGIDGIWVTEHHFTYGYTPSPLTFLAAVAARTTSIRLGSAVLLPDLYHPVRLAEDIASLDILSNGRVALGVGLGNVLEEFECFGVDPKKRVSRLREVLDILELAWSGADFSYHGQHFDLGPLTVIPPPVQDPHPPILGGAVSVAGAQRVARWGLPLQWIDRTTSDAYLKTLVECGHSLENAVIDGYLNLFLCDDPDATWDAYRQHFVYQRSRNTLYGLHAIGPSGSAVDYPTVTADSIDKERQAGAVLLATPEQAVTEIDRLTRGLPVTGLICHNRVCGMPDEVSERHIELLATVVKPAIADFGGSRPR
jgi:alkanesulfonate monooxygenase SsuD/methylene tetrahydromethanopterin reductase-like flavin-dependent oxidoreductase (luciferase family)